MYLYYIYKRPDIFFCRYFIDMFICIENVEYMEKLVLYIDII